MDWHQFLGVTSQDREVGIHMLLPPSVVPVVSAMVEEFRIGMKLWVQITAQ